MVPQLLKDEILSSIIGLQRNDGQQIWTTHHFRSRAHKSDTKTWLKYQILVYCINDTGKPQCCINNMARDSLTVRYDIRYHSENSIVRISPWWIHPTPLFELRRDKKDGSILPCCLPCGIRKGGEKIEYFQFPDKTGFTLRCKPASGISAALRPAKLVRDGIHG